MPTNFGKAVSDARKAKGFSLRDLADRLKKEDGVSISAQYLNDIEHGKRNPPPVPMIRQMARTLGIEVDYLLMLGNELPEADRRLVEQAEPGKVHEALEAFRRTLRDK